MEPNDVFHPATASARLAGARRIATLAPRSMTSVRPRCSSAGRAADAAGRAGPAAAAAMRAAAINATTMRWARTVSDTGAASLPAE